MTPSTPDRTESGLSWTSGGRRMSEDTRAGRPCPVEDCSERFLSAHAAGRHLADYHEPRGKWADERLKMVDNVDGGDVVIFDRTNGRRWIQSDTTVEITGFDEPAEVRR